MEEKMSRWGIGPVFFSLSLGYGIIMVMLSHYFYPVFKINILPYWVLTILGIALIAIGLPFWLISVKSVMRAYNAGKLITDGVYRCCRHPVYASWTVFIIPGIALLLNSWTALTTPLFMYFMLHNFARKEEIYLEHVFGPEYLDYKNRVPCIFPVGFLK